MYSFPGKHKPIYSAEQEKTATIKNSELSCLSTSRLLGCELMKKEIRYLNLKYSFGFLRFFCVIQVSILFKVLI